MIATATLTINRGDYRPAPISAVVTGNIDVRQEAG
jgi:hypothetical protein